MRPQPIHRHPRMVSGLEKSFAFVSAMSRPPFPSSHETSLSCVEPPGAGHRRPHLLVDGEPRGPQANESIDRTAPVIPPSITCTPPLLDQARDSTRNKEASHGFTGCRAPML